MSDVLVEACVESAVSAVAAERGGAQRIELCANLVEGGTTPSEGTMVLGRARLSIPMYAMIRPRGGDFCYTDLERDIMFRDIEVARRVGMNGIVFGALTPGGEVDVPLVRSLVEACRPLGVTFHRAFDVCRDPEEALDALIDIGVERILTSGQQANAVAGLQTLLRLIERAGDRITVMPGGGIDHLNIEKILRETGAREVHVHVSREFASPMIWRNKAVCMGADSHPDEYRRTETDAEGIRAVVVAARSA